MSPPPGRHRNLGPLQRFLRRSGTIILVIAALGVGDFVVRSTPDVDKRERPFVVGDEQDTTVEARLFTATLLKTRTAAIIQSGGSHETQGVWIILRMRFVALRKPLSISYAAVVDARGRSFYASDRVKQTLATGGRILQPGIGVEGDVVFEVPRDASELTAEFSESSGSRAMQSVAGITLPLGDGLFITREPVTLDPVEVKP